MAPPTAPPTPTPATTRVKQSFLAILLLLPRPHLSSPPHALASTPALLILLHQKTMGSAFFLQRRGRKWNPQIASQKENRERPNAPQTHSSKCLRHKRTRQRWIAREQSDGVGALIFPCNKEGRRGPCGLATWMDETLHNLNNEDRIKWMKH